MGHVALRRRVIHYRAFVHGVQRAHSPPSHLVYSVLGDAANGGANAFARVFNLAKKTYSNGKVL